MLERLKNMIQGEVAGKSAAVFGINVAAIAFGLLINLALARLLGPEQYGAYAYAFVWVDLLALLAVFGFDKLIVREFAKYQSKTEWGLIRGIYRWSTWLILGLSIGFAVIAYCMSLTGIKIFQDEMTRTAFQLSLIIIPIQALSMHRQAALQGIHKVLLGQLPEKVIRPGMVLILVGVAALFFPPLDTAVQAIVLVIIAIVASYIAGQYLYSKNINKVAVIKPDGELKVNLFKVALSLVAIASIYQLATRVDVIMLGYMMNTEAVGIYNIPLKLAGFISFPLFAFNVVLAPTISKLYSKNKMIKLQNLAVRSARLILLASVPIALVLLFGRDYILPLFGEEYTAGSNVLIILCLGQLVNVSISIAGYLLIMTNYQKLLIFSAIGGMLANVVLNLLLIPTMGIKGAAYATVASIVVDNLMMLIFVVWKLKFNPLAIGNIKDEET